MIEREVIIVGGGPAGSSCAGRLKKLGIDCLVLDQAAFPRFKTCAGWITPQVLSDLGIRAEEYPHGLTAFSSFQVAVKRLRFRMPTRQYAIRRWEFDAWLLERSGAEVRTHAVRQVEQAGGRYILDGAYAARYLVGAGGTHCPVYRALFEPRSPKARPALIVAQEEEFQYDYRDPRCHLWFLQNRLPGYAWYVPKRDGYVNVGVGGKAEQLKANGDSLKNHWNLLVEMLERQGLVRGHAYKPSGHSYYLSQRSLPTRLGNALLAGDALGLATVDMGEGIGPAIRSGQLAAEAIVNGGDYSLRSIGRASLPALLGLG